MKKLYEMPTVELTKFDVEDVITASSAIVSPDTFAQDTGADVVTEWGGAGGANAAAWNDALGI